MTCTALEDFFNPEVFRNMMHSIPGWNFTEYWNTTTVGIESAATSVRLN